jgi:hypothetical protein
MCSEFFNDDWGHQGEAEGSTVQKLGYELEELVVCLQTDAA